MTGSRLNICFRSIIYKCVTKYQFVLVRLISKDKLIRNPHTCLSDSS